MQTSDQKLLTLRDIARVLRLSSRWVREEAEANRIPHLKAGKRLLFNRSAVEQHLLERARDAGKAVPNV